VWEADGFRPNQLAALGPPTTPASVVWSGRAPHRDFPRSEGCAAVATVERESQPPKWIKPQLTRVVDEAPAGDDWLHELKYDGYRMHARLDRGKIRLLTRTGLDWSNCYRRTRCP
jgi:ATP-dependent DNA ligase